MISTDEARTVVAILGNVIALFLFLSPMPTFIKIWKKGRVEQYSSTPYLATFVNCMLWVLYELPVVRPNSMLVVTINGAGVFIEMVYLTLYITFSRGRKKLTVALIILAEIVFVVALAILTISLSHTHRSRTLIVGIVAIIFNVLMYASPLYVMKMVITTKSVEYMPFFLSLASLSNGVCWLAYALIRFDPFIAVPNGLGTILSVVQLVLYATYYESTQRQLALRNAKEVEFGLSDVALAEDSLKKTNNVTQNGGRVAQVHGTLCTTQLNPNCENCK